MKTKHKIHYRNRNLTVGFSEYSNKRPAIVLYTARGEEWTVATVNIPEYPLKDNEVIIKSYEDSELLPELIKAGVVKSTGIKAPSGFIEAEVCELLIDIPKPLSPEEKKAKKLQLKLVNILFDTLSPATDKGSTQAVINTKDFDKAAKEIIKQFNIQV